ncbi:bacteriocin BlpO [Streptococcus pneumoniae]|nr:bacteriocin BlpO [Streptococcus pneumoniae]
MDIKMMEQFEIMDTDMLTCVEGGGWIQCGLGVVGGALTGGVSDGAVGTVTLPFFGTVSGAAAGFWGGGATGAATLC